MQIGELSRRTGVSVRMLRYYEQEGLLRPARRQSGYRDFGPAEEEQVRRIRLLGEAGLTLAVIRTLLPCVRGDGPGLILCDEVRAALTAAIAGMDTRIEALAGSRRLLAGYLDGDP
ncbi:MAG: MerR family transcriptional regulator [Telmatospirillum sp.]|nr:MerR family transcriptional regulator [Telmatospirillum sp.]